MNCEILSVGTEILLGDILNTDTQFVSSRLSALGINVFYHATVGDNPARLREHLEMSLSRSDMVIMTGGLGPTYDDLTKETAASVMGFELCEDAESLARIEAFFARMGRTMTPNNKKQAMQPKGGIIIRNDYGTAPGCAMVKNGKVCILLPGPPRELFPMFDEQVVPFLKTLSDETILSHTVKIFGMGESSVENKLKTLMEESKNPTLAPYAKTGEVELRVTAKAKNEAECEKLMAPMLEKVKAELGDVIYGIDVPSLETALVALAREKGKTVACAESCTGGLIAKRITDVSGSSDMFGFGMVTYANEAKMKLLGVAEQTLAQYGAVSEETAKEMALGTLRVSGADIAVATTGIAGPTGGTDEKPVGLVYIAVANEKGVDCQRFVFGRGGNERALVRELAASNAINMLRKKLL